MSSSPTLWLNHRRPAEPTWPIRSHSFNCACPPVAWKGGHLAQHHIEHHYQTKTFFWTECRKSILFFVLYPLLPLTCHGLIGRRLAFIRRPLASDEDSEKMTTINQKQEGQQREGTRRWPRWCTPWPGARSFHSCNSWPHWLCCTAQPHDQSHHICRGRQRTMDFSCCRSFKMTPRAFSWSFLNWNWHCPSNI